VPCTFSQTVSKAMAGKVKSLSLATNASAWECRYGQDILPHRGKGPGIYDSGWALSLRF
jgi:hypothetical protein